MKYLKISMIAVIAVAMAIGGSAYTAVSDQPESSAAMHYIRYDGDDNSENELHTTTNWVDLGTPIPSLECSETDGVVCYVKFDGDLAAFQTFVADKDIDELKTANVIQAFREE